MTATDERYLNVAFPAIPLDIPDSLRRYLVELEDLFRLAVTSINELLDDIENYEGPMRRSRTYIAVENLAPGSDISNRPIYAAPVAMGLNFISILTRGASAGVDDSNTVVITVKDGDGNTIVTKTYNSSTQPPSSDIESLGTLANNSIAAGEVITFSITCGATANMPAFFVVVE